MSLPQRRLPHCICVSMCVCACAHRYVDTYVPCRQFSVCAWAYCRTVKGTGLFIGLFERNSTGIRAKENFVSPGNKCIFPLWWLSNSWCFSSCFGYPFSSAFFLPASLPGGFHGNSHCYFLESEIFCLVPGTWKGMGQPGRQVANLVQMSLAKEKVW